MAISLDPIERCKAAAAKSAVEENIKTDCILGIGSGSTMKYVLESLTNKCNESGIKVKCIPTSLQSKQLIHDYGFQIVELNHYPIIDVTIDGADEVDKNLVAIKGGGACLFQEKLVASNSKRFIVVADYRKNSSRLGENWTKGIPIEVHPSACDTVMHKINQTFDIESNELVIRTGSGKAGPVITDNGNVIIDWRFTFDSSKADWRAIADKVKLITGVIETGIFAGLVSEAHFGQEDGTVFKREAKL